MEFKMVVLAVCLLCLSTITVSGQERSGVCPAPPQGLVGVCAFDPTVHCVDDTACSLSEKCCPHDCNSICKPAIQEGLGECPAPSSDIGTCEFVPGVNCLENSECGHMQRCCSEGCGKVCKDVYLNSVSKLTVSVSFLLLTSLVAASI